MSRYRPDGPVMQMDGSQCEHVNCWAATGAFCVDAATAGARKPEPTFFRFKAGKGGPDCQLGGIADVQRGLANFDLRSRMTYYADVPRAELRRKLLRRTGLVVVLECDFEAWPPEDNCQPGFRGYHTIAAICGDEAAHRGEIRVADPLCRRYRWVKADGVLDAAQEYSREHREGASIDALVVTPPMEK